MNTNKRTAVGPLIIKWTSAAILLALCLLQPAAAQGQWTTPDGSGNISNTNTGNVGVGTTGPGRKLSVINTAAQSEEIIGIYRPAAADTSAGRSRVSFEFRGDAYSQNPQLYGWSMFPNTVMAKIGAVPQSFSEVGSAISGTHASLGFFVSSAGHGGLLERMTVVGNGNVGIGTTTPATRFEVVGPGTWVAKFKRTDNSNGGIMIDSPTGFNPNLALATNGAVKWYLNSNASDGDKMQFWEQSGTQVRFTFTQAGSLGIGITAPNYKLDVQGGSINTSGGLCIAGVCKTNWSQVSSQWANGTGGTINYVGGSVGVGITSPIYSLDVNGGVNGFRAKAATVSANDAIATFENNSAIQVIVRGNGNVGIGTVNPTKPLDVAGDINSSGTITGNNVKAKYQDVAEWVESSQELPAGTVVVLDETKSNQVVASTQAYDSRVAGVISLRPGITLGEEGEGRVLVSTTGRVKVKVDATNGPIKIGDLLVTSDREGFAMKSLPLDVGGVRFHRPGTIVGKALEPLAQGTGEILVLLSMQ